MTYVSTIKDRLISFNGIKIDYDSENPLNPTKYGSNSYTFEGRRLVKLSLSGTSYDYIYNDQGLRVKKVDNKGNTWYYTYDGDKLISEISSKARLDFLYDENGYLYGFIKDKTEKYLYIRDCLQNILGIADINGNTIVKYDYDAWGLTKKIEDSSTSHIGDLNPFRYKGYYYDSESAMYYCKTRYYVPLWGRWLNADSPYNLSYDKISGINLYGYCGNNPIISNDKNGKFWFTLLSTFIGGIVGMISSVVSAACSGEEVTWKTAVSGFVGGAVSGLVIGLTKGTGVGLASYASAAAESITCEIWDYASGDKELSEDNIMSSLFNVAKDTAINGTMNYVADGIGGSLFPKFDIKKGWFVPKKFISFFTKSFGKKIMGGQIVGGIISTGITIFKNRVEDIVEEFTDYIKSNDPVKMFN